MRLVEVYVVVEDVGEPLRGSCVSAGAGLLRLADDNTLERILDYGPPDGSAAKRAFVKRVRDTRRRLDTKTNLNLANLERIFQESYVVTAPMKKSQRDGYLLSVEAAAVAWRTWGEELSERLDQADADGNETALSVIETEIASFDPTNAATAA